MSENPYQTPGADLSQPVNTTGSPVKAVVVGVSIDILGTLIISFIGSIIFGVMLLWQDLTPEQIETYLLQLTPTSVFSIVLMVLGTLMSVLAGYVAARIVNYMEYKTALMVGVISSLIGILLSFGYSSPWLSLFSVLSTVIAVLIGAWLFVRGKARVSD